MLVHIKLLDELDEHMNFNYDKVKTIGFEEIKDIDKFAELIHSIKKHGAGLIIDNNWYSIEDYGLNFPNNSETVPCFTVYVTEYC